jgi:hypothetical protein
MAMGQSSSIHGTGAVDTLEPTMLGGKKKTIMLKRFKDVVKVKKNAKPNE